MSEESYKKRSSEATNKARQREIENENKREQEEAKKQYEELGMTQEEVEDYLKKADMLKSKGYYIGRQKSHNDKIAFAQIIQHNVQALIEHEYLTTAEKSFLFDILGYVDFGSNAIVVKAEKNKSKRQKKDDERNGLLPETATVSYISEIIKKARSNTAGIMNSLKEKSILATGETGMKTGEGRVCSERTWFVNPHIIYCGDKGEVNRTLQMMFKHSLTSFKDKNGKPIKLPMPLFKGVT